MENRGTEVIRGGLLAVETPLGPRHFTLEAMKPGAIATRKLVVDTRLAELEGAVHYHSTLTLPDGFRDGNASDNQMSSSFPDPSTRETGE